MKNFLKNIFRSALVKPLSKEDEAFLDAIRGPKNLEPDGTVKTKHGRNIIPYRIEVRVEPFMGWHMSADLSYYRQPRMVELAAQIAPLRSSPKGDRLHLNEETGDFYLQSDVDKNGLAHATILGQIDVRYERDMLKIQEDRILIPKSVFGPKPR